MKRFYSFLALLCLIFGTLSLVFENAPMAFAIATTPFNACTAYAPPFVAQSFASGTPYVGCANWSAMRGRAGCTKVKGVCPLCVTYPGDHLQMWLPEFFIEVTTAPGESVFTMAADGLLISEHLALGSAYWKAMTGSPFQNAKRAQPDAVSNSMFWHARILVMPYANMMGSYAPLPGVLGTEAPTCFAGLSEFMPAQWAYNLVDAPFAFAWAPVGSALCNTPEGATLSGGLEAAKGAVSKLGLGKSFSGGHGELCARPVDLTEASLKMFRPTSDALAPITMGPQEISSKLCMGAWGNLLPRSGWSVTGDPLVSAMQAAYRFTSVTADFNLNDNWKLRSDDQWQIVFPWTFSATTLPGTCFKPGTPFPLGVPPPAEDFTQRHEHELNPLSNRKGTYVIAVWRRRETCEEPLETIGGWSAAHKLNLEKNTALCSAMNAQGGWR